VVLTAAHCNVGLTEAAVGPNRQILEIVSGTVHPNWKDATTNFDMMVLKLAKPVSNPSLIQLNPNDAIPVNNAALKVIGLGATSENGPYSNTLQEVTVNAISNNECSRLYDGGITDAMLCAGVPEGGKDACQGRHATDAFWTNFN